MLSDFHKRFKGKKKFESFAASSCTDEMASKTLSGKWLNCVVQPRFFL